MKTVKTAILIALCASIALAMFSTTSLAITGNSKPSTTPYVGVVVLFSDLERTQAVSYSTGILIAPDVVLTAGHSVIGGVAASVCFDQKITATMDEEGNMDYETQTPVYTGTLLPYPAFADSVDAGAKPSKALKTSDVGLIILDQDVEGIEPATLPSESLADTIAVKTALEVIGYDVQYQITPNGNGHYTWDGSVNRNSATVQLLSTHFQGSDKYIKCTANAAQGKGGVTNGDSGGPVLYNDNGKNVVLAVSAYVSNANSAGVTYHTRIDNPDVLSWINEYIGTS